MKVERFIFGEKYKGTRGYLRTQGHYILAKTLILFFMSASLLIAGFIATGTRKNWLTVAAILGCLPACKFAIDTFMYLRYKGCTAEHADLIETHIGALRGLFDVVFTSYDANFVIAHLTVKGKTVCGFAADGKLDEQALAKHLDKMLKNDGFNNVTVKIFTDIRKYTERLDQLQDLETDETCTDGILETLKNISL